MNISDQYLVLDTFRADPLSDITNGQYRFNLSIQGVTTETTIGVVERLNNIVEIEVEPFYFPYDFNFTEINQVMPINIPHYVGYSDGGLQAFPPPVLDPQPPLPDRISVVLDTADTRVTTNKTQLTNGVRANISRLTNLLGTSVNLEYLYAEDPQDSTITSIGLLGAITMQIQETGNQSISDYRNSRHNFNFRPVLETVTRVVVAKLNPPRQDLVDDEFVPDNTLVSTNVAGADELFGTVPDIAEGSGITELQDNIIRLYFGDNGTAVREIQEKFYFLTPTKNMYIFTDPINSFQEITTVFKNVDRVISFRPCVYDNVPMVFLCSTAIEALNLLGVTDAGTNAYMAFIVPNHGLIPGDCITINDTLAVVMGSYDMQTSGRSIMSAQVARDVIVINPLISVPNTPNTPINTVYVKIYVHKRRIRIPLRFRRAINRKTNNIISTS